MQAKLLCNGSTFVQGRFIASSWKILLWYDRFVNLGFEYTLLDPISDILALQRNSTRGDEMIWWI